MMFSSPQVTPEHLSRSPQPWAAFDPEPQIQSAKLWAHGKGVSACTRMRQVVVSPLSERTGGEGRGDDKCAHTIGVLNALVYFPPLLQLLFSGLPRLAPVKHFNVPRTHHALGGVRGGSSQEL